MDADRLRQIREAEAATTPGPWETEDGSVVQNYNAAAPHYVVEVVSEDVEQLLNPCPTPADAHFIALARTAVPELLVEVKRLNDQAEQDAANLNLANAAADVAEGKRDQARGQAEALADLARRYQEAVHGDEELTFDRLDDELRAALTPSPEPTSAPPVLTPEQMTELRNYTEALEAASKSPEESPLRIRFRTEDERGDEGGVATSPSPTPEATERARKAALDALPKRKEQ